MIDLREGLKPGLKIPKLKTKSSKTLLQMQILRPKKPSLILKKPHLRPKKLKIMLKKLNILLKKQRLYYLKKKDSEEALVNLNLMLNKLRPS
jgi:hypothetical protein